MLRFILCRLVASIRITPVKCCIFGLMFFGAHVFVVFFTASMFSQHLSAECADLLSLNKHFIVSFCFFLFFVCYSFHLLMPVANFSNILLIHFEFGFGVCLLYLIKIHNIYRIILVKIKTLISFFVVFFQFQRLILQYK